MNNKNAVRSTRKVVSFVHTLVGGILFGVGVVVFALNFFFSDDVATLVLMITGGSLILPGVIELIIAYFFHRSVRRQRDKLDRLKNEGLKFDAEIVQIHRHMSVHVGFSTSAYAECSYINKEGKTCLVKSTTFLVPFNDTKDSYVAHVYVSQFDPFDYAVEVLTRGVQADFDYR